MNQNEKRRLDNQLLALGLHQLNDPGLIQQLADLVSCWPGDKTSFFIDLLNECNADQRYEMYNAMAPKLRFTPPSYPDCEVSIAMKASEMVSQGRMRVEGEAPKPYHVGGKQEEPKARATMRCHACKQLERFTGETPVDAVVKARKKGWIRTAGFDVETCPKCVDAGKVPSAKEALAMGVDHAYPGSEQTFRNGKLVKSDA